jgi:hypothetical protein
MHENAIEFFCYFRENVLLLINLINLELIISFAKGHIEVRVSWFYTFFFYIYLCCAGGALSQSKFCSWSKNI